MIVALSSPPRDYAWGSLTGLSNLLGIAPSGRPEAEMWFGTHPGWPTVVSDVDGVDTLAGLRHWLGEQPLGFLLKVLAAGSPLSIQVHPNEEQARAGFARENASGVALDDPARNYRDASAKPELIMAVGGPFEALSGFRDPGVSADHLRMFARAAAESGDADGASALGGFADLVAEGDLLAALAVTLEPTPGIERAAAAVVAVCSADGDVQEHDAGTVAALGLDVDTVRRLSDEFGTAPGILAALLLNRVSLLDGEALFLDAGNVHAYLSGVGIEVMAASDNVLRGGLTRKYIDVPEVLRVARGEVLDRPRFEATELGSGVRSFEPPVSAFALHDIHLSPPHVSTGSVMDAVPGPGIALCIAGDVTVVGGTTTRELPRGEAIYVSADEFPVTFSGSGRVILATPGKNF